MKKIVVVLIYILGLLTIQQHEVRAQSVYLWMAGDTLSPHCSLTDPVTFVYHGYAVGYQFSDSVSININFGDGSDTTFKRPLIFGQSDGFAFHEYTQPGFYNILFTITGPNGATDTLMDQLMIATNCGQIEGLVYYDANSDCVYNGADYGVQTLVTASYNGVVIAGTYSDFAGNYYLTVPSGFTYTVDLLNTNLMVTCPAQGFHTITTLPSTGIDFGVQCYPTFDLTGRIIGRGFRTTNYTTIQFNAINKFLSCNIPNGTVTITLDPMLSYIASQNTPASINGNTIVFNAGPLNAQNPIQFTTWIMVLTNSAANIGDTLCITMTVDPIAGDADPSDNTIVACLPVSNSFDPNEKSEAHVGSGSGIVAPGTELDYTIQFQNLGNDDAYEVNILDTIDMNLDINSIRVNGMSHDGNVYINGRTLKFAFHNINLPAASVNEPESHGWISYSISPNPGLPLGTAVTNHADIYFDFNAAVVTNTVTDVFDIVTEIQTVSAESVNIYPNPADDYFMLNLPLNTDAEVNIMDVSGRIVISGKSIKGSERISIQSLQPGLYTVSVISVGKQMTAKLFVK